MLEDEKSHQRAQLWRGTTQTNDFPAADGVRGHLTSRSSGYFLSQDPASSRHTPRLRERKYFEALRGYRHFNGLRGRLSFTPFKRSRVRTGPLFTEDTTYSEYNLFRAFSRKYIWS